MEDKKNVTFVAEIGLNYNGNISLCYELIKEAKYAGANIAKFQLGWRAKKGEINHLDKESLKKLHDWANHFEIEIMFSVFNDDSFKLLLPFNPKRFKIASRTLIDDFNLVKKILKTNKQTIISLGFWKKKTLPFKKNKQIKYLWCKSEYPAFNKHLNDFPKNFSTLKFDGLSDHCLGIDTSLLAISRGANIIERHFTLDKSSTVIRDHALSSTPDEFSNLVKIGSELRKKYLKGI